MDIAHTTLKLKERFAKMLVLGLGNRARHGKDSFAEAVDSHFAIQHAAAAKHGLTSYKPVVVQRLAFADALYREVNQWLATKEGQAWLTGGYDAVIETGIHVPLSIQPTPNAEVSARAPHGKHVRLLQFWGTEYRRAQNQNYWVDQWKAAISPKANIVIATDMRFFNEADTIKSVGGYTIQVNRKNVDGTPFVDPSRDKNHPSETQLDGYNYDFEITVKTGDQSLLEEYAITLVHYLRALKGHK
jgi:hypothetical protein